MQAAATRADAKDPSARIGEWALGRWRLDELLGTGGMSTVYGAVHRTNGKRVAVKVLHPELVSMRDAVERFLGEGGVANLVDHAGAVSVFDDGTMDDGALCLVMERLVGGSLDQYLSRRGPLPVHETVLVLDRLLDILAAAHRAGVVHRDVKPDNVFITTSGAVKLLDFGIARSGGSSSQTAAGAILGTPAYMPPEQAEGRWTEVDERADVFAAGAVAVALLAGEPPRCGETSNLTLLAAMSHPLEGVRARGLAVPPAVADVIERAIAWRREDRHPSVAAMAAALHAAWSVSCRTTLAEHERHLAPLGMLLAAPPRESGTVVRRPDPDMTERMSIVSLTMSERRAPAIAMDATIAEPSRDPLARAFAAIEAAWPSSLGRAPSPPQLVLGLAAAMVLALVLGVGVGQVVTKAPSASAPPSATPAALPSASTAPTSAASTAQTTESDPTPPAVVTPAPRPGPARRSGKGASKPPLGR